MSTALVTPETAVRAGKRLVRALDLAGRATVRGFVDFYNSDNLTFAASIAYYTLLSLFPFLLLVFSILSKVALSDGNNNEIMLQAVLSRALPRQFEFVMTRLHDLAAAPLNLSLIGFVVTLWASMGVFGAVTSAVNHAWGVEKNYGFFKHKLIAFVMMLGAGLLAIAALLLIGSIQVIEARWFSVILDAFPGLRNLTGFAYRNAPTPMIILMAGLVYYFVPNAQVRLRDVWFGAVLAGLLWRLAFDGFSWYVRDLSRFSVHGSVTAVVVFLIWVYMSAVIFLYGVEVTAAYARLRKHIPSQAPAAPPLEG